MKYILLLAGLLALALPIDAQQAQTITLDEAVAQAMAHNPQLAEAAARNAGAQATATRAVAPQRPQVGLSSRYVDVSEVPSITVPLIGQTFTLGQRDSWLTTLSASQVLYSGGRLAHVARQARDAAQAAMLAQARARQSVVYGVTQAYLALLAAQHDREVAGQALTAATDHLKDAQARLDARAAPKYDVLRAEVGVEEARQDTVRAESGIAIAHAVLLRALGVSSGQYIASELTPPTVSAPPALDDLLARAHGARPELQAADWQVRAAEAAVAAAKAERAPVLALTGDYQYASPESPLMLTRWSVGAVASVALLDGGAVRAKVREAQALLAQQTAVRDTLRAAIAADVRIAYARLLSAREQYTVAQRRVALAEETRRLADVRYREGVSTATEVADVDAALTRARQGLTRAMTDWLQAQAEVAYATGT